MGRGICLALLLGLLAACASQPQNNGRLTPAEANTRLGFEYLQRGDYETALAKFRKALAANPRRADTHHYLAELYRRTGDPRRSRNEYQQALKLAPKDAMILRNYAIFLCGQGDYREAMAAFKQAARDYQGLQRAANYEQAGLCAMQAHDWSAAEESFRAALQEKATAANALYQLARLSVRKGAYLKARAFLQRLLAVHAASDKVLQLGIEIETALDNPLAVANYRRQLAVLGKASSRANGKGDGHD